MTQKKSKRITDAELAIKAMQYEIAELKFEVAALKQLRNTRTARDFLAEIRADKTPNEKRKAVIAEAKAFVAEYEVAAQGSASIREGNGLLRKYVMNVKYNVDSEKRAVVSLLYHQRNGELVGKGITKCAPDDVFNADIGKAIALGRALGLDVSKFEHAANPTAHRKGTVVRLLSGGLHRLETNHKSLPSGFSFVDDTDAQY